MQLDAHEQRVVDTVDRVGWMVMKVGPNKDDQEPRWFAYTVGLAVTRGWPELICFGLNLDMMAELLNKAVYELKSKRKSPSPHLVLTEVVERFSVRLEIFPERFFREHLGCAMWFAHHRGLKREQFACLQLLWPDKAGRFPTDAGCNDEVRRRQAPVGEVQ